MYVRDGLFSLWMFPFSLWTFSFFLFSYSLSFLFSVWDVQSVQLTNQCTTTSTSCYLYFTLTACFLFLFLSVWTWDTNSCLNYTWLLSTRVKMGKQIRLQFVPFSLSDACPVFSFLLWLFTSHVPLLFITFLYTHILLYVKFFFHHFHHFYPCKAARHRHFSPPPPKWIHGQQFAIKLAATLTIDESFTLPSLLSMYFWPLFIHFRS